MKISYYNDIIYILLYTWFFILYYIIFKYYNLCISIIVKIYKLIEYFIEGEKTLKTISPGLLYT